MTVQNFEALAASRREWIETVLRPWCREANLPQLRQAAAEWHDFAGRVDVDATLWTWAWERFPVIVHDDLPGVNETSEVCVSLHDGRTVTGFPDGRQSLHGQLMLTDGQAELGPFSVDEIVGVELVP